MSDVDGYESGLGALEEAGQAANAALLDLVQGLVRDVEGLRAEVAALRISGAPRARRYATIQAACGALGISRSSFYRWLEEPGSSLAEHVVRVPPVTGRIRVDLTGIEELLRREQLGAGNAAAGPQR